MSHSSKSIWCLAFLFWAVSAAITLRSYMFSCIIHFCNVFHCLTIASINTTLENQAFLVRNFYFPLSFSFDTTNRTCQERNVCISSNYIPKSIHYYPSVYTYNRLYTEIDQIKSSQPTITKKSRERGRNRNAFTVKQNIICWAVKEKTICLYNLLQ